mgnify:CR=1 FL=1
MKKQINFLVILLFCSIISCKSDDDNCCRVIESSILIQVENKNGENLIDPQNAVFDMSEIKIFYAPSKDGKRVEVDNPQLDVSKGFEIIVPDGNSNESYRLKLFLNVESISENGYSYTFIQWSDNITDELRTEFDLSNNNIVAKKIWLNGELEWQGNKEVLLIIKKKS